MTRKISNAILLSFLIACSNNIIAGTEGLLTSNFNGFYAGGSLGGTITSAKESISLEGMNAFPEFFLGNTNLQGSIITDLDFNIKQSAAIGQLYAGYGRTWLMFYLGGEVFGNFSHYNMKTSLFALDSFSFVNDVGFIIDTDLNDNTFYKSNIKISPLQWGADLRTGFLATSNLLLYGRVGVASAKISLSTKVVADAPYGYQIDAFAIDEQFHISTTLISNSTKNVAALRLGGGLEYSINPHWSIRMDYIYVYYGKLNSADNEAGAIPSDPPLFPGEPGLFGPGFGQIMYSNSVKTIQTNSVMFGVSYYPQIF